MPSGYKPINREKSNNRVVELYLMAQNNYPNRWNPIQENQQRKVKNGTYDFERSIKLQRYLIDDAWKDQKKDNWEGYEDGDGWRDTTVADKNEAATMLAEDFYDNIGYEFKDEIKEESGKKPKNSADVIKYYQNKKKMKNMKKSSSNKKFRK